MAVSVASGWGRRQVRRREAPRVCCIDQRSIATQIVRTIWSRSSGKCWPQISRVHARLPGQFRPGNRGFKRGEFRCWLAESRGSSHLESPRRFGHHGGDAASVLGTVQGSALRSDRACARPSGLDGACAQMIGGQLRDGRRMLFPSGTTAHRSIYRTVSRSAPVSFDRFRTRALHSSVEAHFSRY